MSFSVWLITLNIMLSSSIHVAADGKISFFLWLSSLPVCVCVCLCVYTYTCVCVCVHVYMLHLLYPFIC